MAMQKIISELKMMPDVHGGFFFHSKNGLLYKEMPSIYADSVLNDVGRQLAKMYAARRLNFPDICDINLYFTESAVISRAINQQFFLVLLCNQHVNSGTLSVSMCLAIEEHADELNHMATAQPSNSLTGGVQKLSLQQALAGPLKKPLDNIQHALVDLMGPMAALVYEESLEKWIASGRIGMDLLPEFIELIASELPDVKKAKDFKDRCRNLM